MPEIEFEEQPVPYVLPAPRGRPHWGRAPRQPYTGSASPDRDRIRRLPPRNRIPKRVTHAEIVICEDLDGGPVPYEAGAKMRVAVEYMDDIQPMGLISAAPMSPYVPVCTPEEARLVRHGVLTGRFAKARIQSASDFARRVGLDGSIFVTNVGDEHPVFGDKLHLYRYYPPYLECYQRAPPYEEPGFDHGNVFFVSMKEGELPSYCFHKHIDDTPIEQIVRAFYINKAAYDSTSEDDGLVDRPINERPRTRNLVLTTATSSSCR